MICIGGWNRITRTQKSSTCLKKIWRYQTHNERPQMEEAKTTQRPQVTDKHKHIKFYGVHLDQGVNQMRSGNRNESSFRIITMLWGRWTLPFEALVFSVLYSIVMFSILSLSYFLSWSPLCLEHLISVYSTIVSNQIRK